MSKNLLTLFLMTVCSTLLLFGIYPNAIKFLGLDTEFNADLTE